ncbi:glycosyltransferase [Echinicola jeungdonensis]|uniref:Glycosyltransferase n=1 Tax=Echinicola jeungdonensis TaxID=709343 RepID=A0ABV5J3M9_9BACT|nr:glycosyltransferase [Echinicola jeungdonensis]MDN3668190.1 glycosyltransferase [Echinicola jeungdonensis]
MGMNLLVIFFLGAALLYGLVLVVLADKWKTVHGPISSKKSPFPVTLLVPFRDEKPNLESLIESLGQLTYSQLEIILIDDHSSDGGRLLAEEVINKKEIRNCHVVLSPAQGKKGAIEFGVMLSTGNIILTTDADCQFPPDWVERMVQPFWDEKVQMVAGPVISKSQGNMWDYFQQIEWASILLVTQAFFKWKRPIMCSGANLAYRKEAFQQAGGYFGNHSVLSGDDAFLLYKINHYYGPKAITYLPYRENLVVTSTATDWKGLVEQRARWANKWNKHQKKSNFGTAIGMVGFALVFLFSLGLLVEKQFSAFVLFWGIKVGAEYWALGHVLNELLIPTPWYSYIYASLLHPIYSVVVAGKALTGKFSWKGRDNISNQ